jgi:hypothetical protein
MSDDKSAKIWRARANGLVDSLRDAWRRGVGFEYLPAFDSTRPWAEQEEAFDRRFRPWLFEEGYERRHDAPHHPPTSDRQIRSDGNTVPARTHGIAAPVAEVDR